jgi:hypothetical protein
MLVGDLPITFIIYRNANLNTPSALIKGTVNILVAIMGRLVENHVPALPANPVSSTALVTNELVGIRVIQNWH